MRALILALLILALPLQAAISGKKMAARFGWSAGDILKVDDSPFENSKLVELHQGFGVFASSSWTDVRFILSSQNALFTRRGQLFFHSGATRNGGYIKRVRFLGEVEIKDAAGFPLTAEYFVALP